MAYERLDKTYITGAIWDQDAISRIDNTFEELLTSTETIDEQIGNINAILDAINGEVI